MIDVGGYEEGADGRIPTHRVAVDPHSVQVHVGTVLSQLLYRRRVVRDLLVPTVPVNHILEGLSSLRGSPSVYPERDKAQLSQS